MSNPNLLEPNDDNLSLASLMGRVEKARSSLTPRAGNREYLTPADDDESPNIIPSMSNVGNPTAATRSIKNSPAKPPLPPSSQSQSLSKAGSHASMPREASVGSFTAAYFPPEPPVPKPPAAEVPIPSYYRDPNESKPPPTEMAILGIPDDVSTIANDTLNGSITGSMFNFFRKGAVTPERQPSTNTHGEEIPAGFGGTIQIPSSAKDRNLPMHVDTEPRWSKKKYLYALILALFLLGAIGALSYGFLKVRDLNSLSAPVDEDANGDFTFTLRPTPLATAAPGATPTLVPTIPGEGVIPPTTNTRRPTGQPSRLPTMTPSLVPTISASTSLKQILGDISPSIVANIEIDGTKQKEAFDWLVNDPDYYTYNESKVVQRWALALFSLEIASSRRRLSDRRLNEALETWMKYTDECTWFTSWYENRVACDGTGSFKFLVLRNIGLDGTVPSELALLSRLDTVVLSDNSITGAIPEELNQLSLLEHFEISSNQVGGEIPALLQMEGLKVLDLGNNQLTGQIPNELPPNSQTLKMNNNQLSGSIPEGISNLEDLINLDLSANNLTGTVPPMDRLKLLAEVKLSDTDLNGAMPIDLCSFEIDTLEADCEDIFCSCCTNCESVGTPGPTPVPGPSVAPTNFPSVSAAPSTPRPTPNPTPYPTTEPTQEQCWDRIAASKTCFTRGEIINLTFKNCLPVGNDWIGIYDSGKLAYELYNPMMWEYSCGSQACYGATMDGFLSFDGFSTGTENWPLKSGTYKAWMFRDGDASGPYYAYAATETFTVADSC
mmetsp:Transcript_37249/g.90464  ORF Transcript_37249/g.90464 Transcript_37249/m.90464 type:complete len:779 (-) Transcript_37249:101-2437(-)|eukprot:CAMPEP_0113609654 /NCGR_PEP_ID=MMETSP0017_2-20120614/4610_1 /TAXON_ID=2856 /ORGANISM="Cylindrotheca closterium" /LENGTH=778 /DNA_ID=CAMNT_0000518493 /DNA_START=192 /DNA_END=2528 /DNA_ORIENTATION=+ /assembly_acc=CAM_ASM_000147